MGRLACCATTFVRTWMTNAVSCSGRVKASADRQTNDFRYSRLPAA